MIQSGMVIRISVVFTTFLLFIVPGLSRANSSTQPTKIKIENFGCINDHYYRGGQPKINDFSDLAALGIKAVIDLTNGDGDSSEKGKVEQAGMKYWNIPMTTHQQPTSEKILQFLGIVNDPSQQPVYVHCIGGKHRTGVMTAIYRMTKDHWSADQAFQEMKKYHFGMDFLHPEFKSFVFDYYHHLDRTPGLPEQIKTTAITAAAHQ